MVERITHEAGQRRVPSGALTTDALAEIAHELRTPLGGIAAMAELLAASADEGQRELAEALLASVAHLRRIAGSILDDSAKAAAQEADDTAPDATADIDLRAFLQPVSAAAGARAQAAGLAFSVKVAAGVPDSILLDPTRLRQMIDNLLDNALKVTRRGEVVLAVERIGRQGTAHRLRFAVRDTGPGFTPEQAGSLFEPYTRLEKSPPGTGLGLALVQRYARALGGEAAAEALPEGGAVVWFTILVEAGEATVQQVPARQAGARRVLVVDDDISGRLMLSAMLRRFGCDVAVAANAREALDLLGRQSFDAVTMDMSMRGMDGCEATRAIRAAWPGRHLPVLAVTGRTAERDQQLFRQAGADGFVAKPVSPRALWMALCEAGLVAAEQYSPLAAA